MNDRILRQKVADELDWDPSISAGHVGVAVENGIVKLAGHVPDFAQRWAAEKAAKRVRGVRGLVDEIVVSPFKEPLTDQSIAERAANLLEWNATVPKGAVQVTVNEGNVVLSGSVKWAFQRNAAEQIVRGLYGVRTLTNVIKLKTTVKTEDVKQRIEAALNRQAHLDAKGISVAVEGGTVKLNGRVASFREREAAERAAWAAPGVIAVEDRIAVSPFS